VAVTSPTETEVLAAAELDRRVALETKRRRTFAIISHPDAGKTTLTEKLLLYGKAIVTAGSVRAKGDRRQTVSDWMDIEKERGISIASTVLRFDHRDTHINLVDTPGHGDFSEDTYRVLTAVDAALMVIDAAKGIEARTLKLFEICRARNIPLLTFVNKCDRPSLAPLELLDQIEQAIGIRPTPATWPIGAGPSFQGVANRTTKIARLFERTERGATRSGEHTIPLAEMEQTDDVRAAADEMGLLDAVGADVDAESFLAGASSPMFFGSALWGFGIGEMLDAVVDLAPAPSPVDAANGRPRAIDEPFSAFVFKVQSNMDARHRDRVAFLRICSGRFERGMQLTRARGERTFAAAHVHDVFGRERSTLEEAFPGDIIGLANARDLRLGDTVYAEPPVIFPTIPTFAPELFAVARNLDATRAKQFRSGLQHMDEEGVIQVLRHPDRGDQAPVLGAVGELQFQVFQARLEREFDTRIELSRLSYTLSKETDEEGAVVAARLPRLDVLRRENNSIVVLFPNEFVYHQVVRDHPDLVLR